MTHPTDDQIEQYTMDNLAEPSALEQHILECQGCRQRVIDSALFVAAIRLALEEMTDQRRIHLAP